MPLDPQVTAILDMLANSGAPKIETLPPAQARALFDKMEIPGNESADPVAHVADRTIPGPAGEIPVRVYTPEGAGPFPALVYYHGGGWVLGNLDTHDRICRVLTNGAGCVTVSVDYRLAPEHKFPAAVDDAYAAALWVHEHGAEIGVDPARVAVGGDSAGGNLAAVVCYLARERGKPPLVYQLLFYPATARQGTTASQREFAAGYFLTESQMRWFGEQYMRGPEDADNPLLVPMLIEDLRGLPPALVITEEYDPLRDEGEAYATRLQEAGVPVVQTRYDGMIHGFVSMAPLLDKGTTTLDQAAACLRDAFAKQPASA